jgi:hypothetical protein
VKTAAAPEIALVAGFDAFTGVLIGRDGYAVYDRGSHYEFFHLEKRVSYKVRANGNKGVTCTCDGARFRPHSRCRHQRALDVVIAETW